ncbi:MAG TPA: NnrS family protein, partial [Candidatus Limnocylindrales bacterium]|nr:NnrS family protein [Candidatus Limnocylindrales bacterium]
AGFGVGLLTNLMAALYGSVRGKGPAFPAGFESRFLALLAFLFIAPTIWGFSARWLPVFLGLKPVNGMLLRTALVLAAVGVLLQAAGFSHAAPWLFALAALAAISALHLLRRAERPAKTTGVHSSFPIFVRTAYIWLLIATGLGTCAAYLDSANGWTGASRHALTVGFVSTMVFSIGQRVLPAFAGMKVLYSPRLMLLNLVLLNVGCALRVSSEILAYEGYWPPAGRSMPWSALCELLAVTLFAANLVLTFRKPPAHLMKPANAA